MSSDTEPPDLSTWIEPFKRFASALKVRLVAKTYTTEDAVRYYFWNSLLDGGTSLHDMVPEKAHPAEGMKGKAIDLWIANVPFGPAWLEVKYHRPSPNSQTAKSTDWGELLADFYKLAIITDSALKLVLYVSDPEMIGYHQRREILPLSIDDEPLEMSERDLSDLAKTTQEPVRNYFPGGKLTPSIHVRVLTHAKIEDHEAILYEVSKA